MKTDPNQRRNLYTLTLIPLLSVLVFFTAGCSEQQAPSTEQAHSTGAPAAPEAAQESAPAATAAETTVAAAASGSSAADGEATYNKVCMNCHAAGVAGAPKLGDKAAWAPRIAKGNDALLNSVTNGLNAMPPKGTCMSCSDDELRSAMEYMVSQGS